MSGFTENAHPRAVDGTFTTKTHDAPTGALTPPAREFTPKELAILGMGGPDTVNVYAEPVDARTERGDRPLRPYLPLQPADDDEFFDAPTGALLTVEDHDQAGRPFTRRFQKFTEAYEWRELTERDVPSATQLSAGDVWANLFEEDGSMKSARLSAPHGMLYSDRRHYVHRTQVDEPLSLEQVFDRLHGRRAQLISASEFGDRRVDGIPDGFDGPVNVTVEADGVFRYGPVTPGHRAHAVSVGRVDLYDREGDTVIRVEREAGYGWERVFRAL